MCCPHLFVDRSCPLALFHPADLQVGVRQVEANGLGIIVHLGRRLEALDRFFDPPSVHQGQSEVGVGRATWVQVDRLAQQLDSAVELSSARKTERLLIQRVQLALPPRAVFALGL